MTICPTHNRNCISDYDSRLKEVFGDYCVECCKPIHVKLDGVECYFRHNVTLDPGKWGSVGFLVPRYAKLDRPDMVNADPLYHEVQPALHYDFENMCPEEIVTFCDNSPGSLLSIPFYASRNLMPHFTTKQAEQLTVLCSSNPVHRLRYRETIAAIEKLVVEDTCPLAAE